MLERVKVTVMRKNIKRWCVVLLGLMVLLTGCQAQDDKNVQTSSQEYRIVPTTVALTQTLDALNLDIAGKPDSYKTLPKRYDKVPKVGQPMTPDMEKVQAVHPTHILGVSTIKDETEPKFKMIKAKSIFYDYDSLKGMKTSISQMGKEFNREAEASKLNQKLTTAEEQIRQKAAKQKHPKVLILMGVPGSYLVATNRSYIGNLVEIAGGENVIKEESKQYLASNTEYLYDVDPDIILRLPHGMPEEVKKMFDKEFKENDIWKHFKAVKTGRVYDLEEQPFGITANIDADQAMKELYNIFYNKN